MKKIICVLTLIAVLAMLTACGKSEEKPAAGPTETVTQAPEATKAEATPEPTKAAEATPEPTSTPTPTPTPEPTPVPTEAPTPEPEIEPQVDALGNTPDVYEIDKSSMSAFMVNALDYGGYYVATFDFKRQYEIPFNELCTAKVGDVIDLDGKTVTVTRILSMNENFEYIVEHDTYEDGCRIIVQPDNPEEFYTAEELDDLGYYDSPENAEFGFAMLYDDMFRAYSDWAWDDCYAAVYYTVLYHVNLVITENTVVEPAYYPMDEYGWDFTIDGLDYMHLRENREEQEERQIMTYDGIEMHITEVWDDTGRSTGEISNLREIYSP